VLPVGAPFAPGDPVRGGRDDVLIPVARHRDNGHEADDGPEEEQRDRGYGVRPDHAGRRFLAAPARAAAEQPRGLPRLGGTDAIPGRSLGNLWVELIFIVSSPFAGLQATWLECFAPAVADLAPVPGALGPAPQ